MTDAATIAANIKAWNLQDVSELRDMLTALNGATNDAQAYIDMSSLPTAEIPADVATDYPVWAIDQSGNMLVGDKAQDIMSIAEYRDQ